jgi:hypothetical protein
MDFPGYGKILLAKLLIAICARIVGEEMCLGLEEQEGLREGIFDPHPLISPPRGKGL